MTATTEARPLYLRTGQHAVFGIYHPSRRESSASAVLLLPPWGWDEVASYRSRRAWAEQLAERGHPTLRIDLPGTGDSSGGAADPALVAAWRSTIVVATSWLSKATPSGRVAVIGLGLGGLLAACSIKDGAAIDELVLWATPAHGRAFLREQRAFGSLQSAQYGVAAEADGGLPDGWVETGGFVQAAATISALEDLDVRTAGLGGVSRALLLGRDNIPVDPDISKHFEANGVPVSLDGGAGWGAMCFHPERYQPPTEIFERVATWLEEGSTGADAGSPDVGAMLAHPPAMLRADLAVDEEQILETPIVQDDQFGGFFGVLAEPAKKADGNVCAVFLNAGAVRRVGPNRMWVDAARRWAARGVPTFRVDVAGIGDAEGDAAMYFDVATFYTSERTERIRSILDSLVARGLGPRFVLIGLCAGAFSAFGTAAEDERVISAVAINPRLLVWHPQILARREAQLVGRILEAGIWRRILDGETSPARALEVGRAAAAEATRVVRRRARGQSGRRDAEAWTVELESKLDHLRQTNVRFVLAFSGEEPLQAELSADGMLAQRDRWPNLVLEELPGVDHTLRPVAAQRAFQRLVDRELALVAPVPA